MTPTPYPFNEPGMKHNLKNKSGASHVPETGFNLLIGSYPLSSLISRGMLLSFPRLCWTRWNNSGALFIIFLVSNSKSNWFAPLKGFEIVIPSKIANKITIT